MAQRNTTKQQERALKRIAQLEKRAIYQWRLIEYVRQASGKRLAATRKLWGEKLLTGDLHSHTTYSDGTGSVAEMRRIADMVGLDFLFITDHGTIAQRKDCRELPRTWYGQEPGSGPHHLCLLDGSRKFSPKLQSFRADFDKAREISPFVFVPHPAGWWPQTVYSAKQVKALYDIGDEFAVEVMNGANCLARANDQHDGRARVAWEELLCAGKHVTAVAASDSHCPQGVGSCWTGVLAPRCTKRTVIQALSEGHCFGSEAPLLSITRGAAVMGDTVRGKKGGRLVLALAAADAYGLQEVKLVSQGKTVWSARPEGAQTLSHRFSATFPAKPTYFRLECAAVDDRRAFSSPIYVEPRG